MDTRKQEEAFNFLRDNKLYKIKFFMKKINTLIFGSTGYIGTQLVKLLIKHKYVNIKYLCGNTSVGKKLEYIDKSVKFKLPLIKKFKKKLLKDVDVIFTALPNGDSQKISKKLYKHNVLIDLSADFRIKNSKIYEKWYKIKHSAKSNIKKSIYSIPEFVKKEVKKYKIISCPGCYPTSILIPLVPLIKNKLIKRNNIIIDSKSGYSGAGKGVHEKYKNKNLYESLSVYGIANHRHNPEIQQELKARTNKLISFNFTPHLTPMFRGILTNIYLDLPNNSTINKIVTCLNKTYKGDSFIKIMKPNKLISTNDVINTNNCLISINKSKINNKIIIVCAIDNLIKGGAGQAIQNLNAYYNYPYKEGLQ